VRGVAYRPRQRVLLAARLECKLAAGSRSRNGDERRSLALWESLLAIGDFVFVLSFTLMVGRQEGHPARSPPTVGMLVMMWLQLCPSLEFLLVPPSPPSSPPWNGLFGYQLTRAVRWRQLTSSCYYTAVAAVQCIVIGHVCLLVCGWVCYHDNSKLHASILTKLGL